VEGAKDLGEKLALDERQRQRWTSVNSFRTPI